MKSQDFLLTEKSIKYSGNGGISEPQARIEKWIPPQVCSHQMDRAVGCGDELPLSWEGESGLRFAYKVYD